MPPGKICKYTPVLSGRDGTDALPDCILEHILGFLPATEAVWTCVVACRWRYLWKSATGLRINCAPDQAEQPLSVDKAEQFVDRLLEHRERAPLETCELRFGISCGEDAALCLNRWIHHVLMCRVQILKLSNIYNGHFELDALISQQLMRLELIGVMLNNSFYDFSGCPSLEHLVFNHCGFWYTKKISSKSLKYLSILNSPTDIISSPTVIYAPSLVSLKLDDHWCRTPVFEIVPLLQEAFVRVTSLCPDCCSEDCLDEDSDVEDCSSCYNIEQHKCLLLEGLSEVMNLSMLAESKKIILEWDLKTWPQFNKLKALFLNGNWCVAPDFHALTCILNHSPVLEKLTLELFSKEPEHIMELIGRCSPMDRSPAIPEHLKEIHVKCEVVDKEVQIVLKFLSTLNIYFIFK